MPDIVYRFRSSGHEQVARAIGGITRAAAKANKDQAASQARAEKALEREVNAHKRANARKEADASRAAKKREADAEREVRSNQRRLDRMVRDEERAAQKRLQISQRMWERQKAHRNQALRSLGGEAMRVGAMAIGAGGVAVGAAARRNIRFNDSLRGLARQGAGAGEKFLDTKALGKKFERVALASGGTVTKEGVADAVRAFVTKTGDLDAGTKFAETFATASAASGSDITAIAATAADLFQKFDIQSVKEMGDAFATLSEQGKAGAFELEDAAAQFSKVGAAAERFGMRGPEAVAQLGSLMQIARQATPSGEEASTAVEAMFKQLVMKSGQLESKFGVSVFKDAGKTQTNDVFDIIAQTIGKTGGNQQELQKIFDVRGVRAVSPLISTFNRAKAKTSGTEEEKVAAGMAAVRKELGKFASVTATAADLQRSAAHAQGDASAKLNAVWESFTARVGEQVNPKLEALVDKLVSNDDALDALAGTAGVLLEAFGGLIDFLESVGLFKRKVKSKEEQLTEAEANSASLAQKLEAKGIGGTEMMTYQLKGQLPADVDNDENRAMLDEYFKAKESEGKLAAELAAEPNVVDGPLDESEYQERYAAKASGSKTVGQATGDALLGTAIGLIPGMSLAGAGFANRGVAENAEQADLRDKQTQAAAAKAMLESAQAQKGAADALIEASNRLVLSGNTLL